MTFDVEPRYTGRTPIKENISPKSSPEVLMVLPAHTTIAMLSGYAPRSSR